MVRVMGDKVRVVFIPSDDLAANAFSWLPVALLPKPTSTDDVSFAFLNGASTDDTCFAALPLPPDGPRPIPSDDLDPTVSSWLPHALSAPSSAES